MNEERWKLYWQITLKQRAKLDSALLSLTGVGYGDRVAVIRAELQETERLLQLWEKEHEKQ